ncbi:hypothetical protein DV737_g1704, partial [Chaetothyriales sp. CBS 132003]
MGDPRLSRVDETLHTLFEGLAVRDAKKAVFRADGDLPSDINQAQDLIKRKLLRENASPEKAARFTNLYSRLLAIPVLNQKWAILYLLYKLADDPLREGPVRRALSEAKAVAKSRREHRSVDQRPATATDESDSEEEAAAAAAMKPISQPARPQNGVGGKHGQEDAGPASGAQAVAPQAPKVPLGPSENELLRDLPFNLQGLSSTHLQFSRANCVQLPPTLPVPILSLLYTLAEPCLLYRELADFTAAQGGSLISQSLRAAVGQELRAYLSLVATLEGETRRALTGLDKGEDAKRVRMAGVTLKRCVIWTRDATMGLRLMSLFVQGSKERRGGQVISLVHDLSSSHGDPFVGGFAERLLGQVARPFYEMLRHWIYDGELIDPFHEFFVTEPDPSTRPDVDPRRVATSIWEDKYKLDADMVPSIISSDFAKKVFLIGKSLNFIRHNCADSDWVMQYSKSNSRPLDYANTATLSSTIDAAYATTMSRLMYLMSTKFGLFTHLAAIKKYMLLSQGDFIELLMESLAPNLDRPANSQYRHTLTSQLEHAIRHSNAQFDDPEVLRRLDARMLELSSGDMGWDSFTLEYKITPPCDVVITAWAGTHYLKVFNLLWRIKRVEFSLNTTWRRCMTGSRGVLAAVDDVLGRDWKRARCAVAEMVHFVNQLQYYILFEVIEASWKELQEAMNKPEATLDDLIQAHTKYINSITHKGLLGQQRHPSSSAGSRSDDGFLAQLHYILKCMLSYRDVVDGLYSFSVAEFTKRQQLSAKIEHRTAQGRWGMTEKDLGDPNSRTSSSDDHTLESLRSRLLTLSAEFRSRVNVMLYDLAHQPDVDLRFLGVVMNFNEVYKPVNDVGPATAATTGGGGAN